METMEIRVDLGTDSDVEEVDAAYRSLSASLADDDRLVISTVDTLAPAGTKGAGMTAALVTSAISGVVPLTVNMVYDWLRRRTVPCKLTMKLADGVEVEMTDVDALEVVRSRLRDLGVEVDF